MLALVVGAALAWHGSISPIDPPAGSTFDAALVARGTQLASIGNCAGCHTAQDGRPFAGGVALPTPFGTIHGSNLTPDAEYGIGRWSEAAFKRAMREGIARGGQQLYPAFPYDHFTKLADDDLHALYAFLMTRDPVAVATPANDLRFPFGFRPLVAGWNLLYLDKAPFRPDPAQSAEWNRGAYLAQSLAHCSACHSPRNALGAEEKQRLLAGGEAEGWYVPALNAASPSPVPWSVDQLTTYLRTGLAADHAIAGGPMKGVVAGLSQAPEGDVRAIATYVMSVMGPTTPERESRAKASAARAAQGPLGTAPRSGVQAASVDENVMRIGAEVYAGACAQCHDAGRGVSSNAALRLPLAVALHEPDPRSLIRIVREGIHPTDGARGRWMPAFGGSLTDDQMLALLTYLRSQAAEAPPWPQLAQHITETRSR